MLQPMFHEAGDISLKHFRKLVFSQLGIVFGECSRAWTMDSWVWCCKGVTRPLSLYPIQALLTLNSMTTNAINPRRHVIKFPVVQLELFPWVFLTHWLQMLVDFRIVMTLKFCWKTEEEKENWLKWWIGEFQTFTDPELSNFVIAALNDYVTMRFLWL